MHLECTNIVQTDFNAKIGRESVFGATVGQFSLHETTSSNGLRLIGFAASHNMVVRSTGFRHLDIHKASWIAPDRLTRNQIDHVVIDARHASSILDVRSFRGPNIDSDHWLVAAKVRTRLCVSKIVRRGLSRKPDFEKLHSQQTKDAFSTRLAGLLSQPSPIPESISDMWAHISHSLQASADEVLGFQGPPVGNPWYDQECREATAAKDAAYQRTLQAGATRALVDAYRIRRREEKRLFRRKKRELERRECESIECSRDRNDARNFYQRVKLLTQGFKTGGFACRDDDGNLVADKDIVLKLWRDHFSTLLAGDAPSLGDSDSLTPIDDDTDIPAPSHIEVAAAIQRLKNNKAPGADGLSAELFKAGGDVLVGCMHQLICRIWLMENMPNDWNLSLICPILKKGDATQRTNYRGISLLPVAYRVLTSVLCEKLKPHAEALIGPYQCGFRPGKSTMDQIFTLRQILEKSHENQIDTYYLFVDYKAAFDSPRRDLLYAAMSELGIPAKLTRLCRMTLSNTNSSVKVGHDQSETFNTKLGLRQGDSLSLLLYGAEAWTVTQPDAAALEVFERKILRKIFGPVCVGDTYRIKWNHELYELYDDIDVVSRMNIQRLRWLGHVVRMEEVAPARKVFEAVVSGQRRRGRPRIRWQDQVIQPIASLGIANWRRRAQDRDAWRELMHQAVTR
ncbi:uncharacterized protein LOC122319764 [Drosophila ficusphila]|uniref:uncharacterized protein LOC122319764 n=1 Tax=Drosophila ficusphila TaxID=30025 RepID=UPI001C898AC2|nr:uncharacterized protein LOC122319764 [Drosophila ficusphila]